MASSAASVIVAFVLLLQLCYVFGDVNMDSICANGDMTPVRVSLFEGDERRICFNDTVVSASPNGPDLNSIMLSSIDGDCVNVSGVSTNVIDGIKMVNITVSLNCTSTASMTVPVEVNVTDSNVDIVVSLEDGADPLIEGNNKTLSLKLNVEVNMDVTIEIVPQSTEDYSISPSSVTISAGTSGSTSVTLTAIGDSVLEEPESFSIATMTMFPYENVIREANFSFTINDAENATIAWRHNNSISIMRGDSFNCCAVLQVLPQISMRNYSIQATLAVVSGTALPGIDYTAVAPVTASFSSSIPEHCIHVMTLDRAAGGDVFNVSLSLNTAQRVFIDGPITVNLINASPTNEPTRMDTTAVGTTLSTGSGTQSSYRGTDDVGGPNSAGAIAAGILVPIIVIVIAVVTILLVLFILAKKGKLRALKSYDTIDKVFKKSSHFNLVAPVADEDGLDNDTTRNGTFPILVEETEARDIPVAEFTEHVKALQKDANKGFEDEFATISNPPFSTKMAELPQNKSKNRFLNILPYDNNLVKLKEVAGQDERDYINASWIDGYNRKEAYIACQGPLPESIGDFWRLIWQHKFPTIVMVTRLVEGTRVKCHEYWPKKLGEKMFVGSGLTVRLDETVPFADYCISKLVLIKQIEDGEEDLNVSELTVTHCHYTGWPDHDVPKYPTSMLGFLRRVRKLHPYSSDPLVVHCSAGVGRTGTFMTIDSMLQKIAAESSVNVLQYVKDMRKKRCSMVQTESQYVFIHYALNEIITCGNTEIPAMDIRIVKNKLSNVSPTTSMTGFLEQLKLLDEVSRQPSSDDCIGLEKSHEDKNRHKDRIPYKLHRPMTGGTGYINASLIDGYRARKTFITTQGPLESTREDFWRMIVDSQSKCIVMICQPQEQEKEVDEKVEFGKVMVNLLSETKDEDHNISIRKLEVEGPSANRCTSVTQFHHLGWNDDKKHPDTKSVLKLCDFIQKVQRSTGNRPITVVCSDGSGRSGTFLTVYSEIERLKTEGVVDVFQCIKAARIQRYGLVANEDQYAFIHEALTDFMDKFDTYANFM